MLFLYEGSACAWESLNGFRGRQGTVSLHRPKKGDVHFNNNPIQITEDTNEDPVCAWEPLNGLRGR